MWYYLRIPLLFAALVAALMANNGCTKEIQEGPPAKWEAGELKSAYESFKKLQTAVKNGNMEEAVRYISREKLEQLTESGELDGKLKYYAGLKINYGIRRGGNVTLKEEIKYGVDDYGYQQINTLDMIEEDNVWKVAP